MNHDESLADVERYNPACDEWHAVAPLSQPRRSVAVAAHNGRLYAVGGSGTHAFSSFITMLISNSLKYMSHLYAVTM